jgi:hypothetical protein
LEKIENKIFMVHEEERGVWSRGRCGRWVERIRRIFEEFWDDWGGRREEGRGWGWRWRRTDGPIRLMTKENINQKRIKDESDESDGAKWDPSWE